MPSSLYRIVYASRISPGCQADLKVVMPILLAEAMARNRDFGVTSLLCAHRGWFLQALEGPRDHVVGLFERVAADPRHHGAKPVVEGQASDRLFGCWSIAARRLSTTDIAVLSALGPGAAFDPTTLSSATILRLLTTVGEVHARALSQQQALEGAVK